MKAEIDPDGNTTAYAYDGAGDMTAMTQVLNGFTVTQTYSYNQAGQMVSTVDEDNRTDSFTYDADGRLLNEVQYNSSGTATETIAYTYDQAGNMLTASNTEGGSTYAYSFQYNGAGQVTSVSEPFGASLSFGYDLAGNRTTVVDSINGSFTGTESLSYNADDKLTTLTYTDASDSLSINFSYNQADQMTQETMYSSGTLIATVSESYDGAGDAKTITYTESDGATLDSFSYAYDKAQELESESDSSGPTTNYTYNSLGELTAAGTQAYSFDAAGNPDSSGDTLESSAPSSGNELNTFVVPSDVPTIAGDTITYTYDNAGNVATAVDPTASTSWSYGYDNANNITSAALSVSGTLSESVNYTYDAFGNMIQEVTTTYGGSPSTTTQEFAMDGWNPAKAGATGNSGFDTWAVMNGSGQLQTRNIQGNGIDQILARIDNATYGASDSTGLYFDLTDRLGSVRYVLSSTTDLVVASIDYDAWGNVTSGSSSSMGMYGWDGYDYDAATKLYFDNARVYDPVSQRWMSQDPMGDSAGDSNLYRYVNNAPTDARDPSGMYLVTKSEQTAREVQSYLKNGTGPLNDTVGLGNQKDMCDEMWNIDSDVFELPSGRWLVLSNNAQARSVARVLDTHLTGDRAMNPAMRLLRSLPSVQWTNEVYWSSSAWETNTKQNASFKYTAPNSDSWLTINKVDLSSQDMLAAKFLTWYTTEKRAGLGWLAGLPLPPEHLTFVYSTVAVGSHAGSVTYVTVKEPVLPEGWEWDLGVFFFGPKYHPGAQYGIRKKADNSIAGNQATYNKDGALIRSGLGAGTADKVSPEFSVAWHGPIDVAPFEWAYQLDKELGGDTYRKLYIEVRPAVNPK